MNNDLISREALKEQINATDFDFGDYYDNTDEIRKRVCEAIDNALTVQNSLLPLASDMDSAYMRGYEVGKAEGIMKANARPQGDYISRSVLDEIRQLYKKYQPNLATEVIEFGNALEKLIDNAQAIPLPSEQIAWEQGYEAGLAQGKNDRPQGEWIRVEPTEEDIEKNLVPLERIECSNCHLPNRHIQYDEYHDEITVTYHNTHYCPNCGADMRKGGVE